jgi:ATP-binding cassette, subfamily B, bacterial
MSFFSGLNSEKYDREYTDRYLITRILGYFKPQSTKITFIALLILLGSLLDAWFPVIVSKSIELLETTPSFESIAKISLSILMLGISSWGMNWLRRSLTVRAVSDVVLDLATNTFNAASKHDLSFFDEFSSGRVVSRITTDTQDFGQLVMLSTDVIAQIIQALILSIVLINIDLRLSLYLFAFLPVIALLAISFRRAARKVTRQGMRSMANVNAAIKETVSGIAVAKNFRQETGIYSEFDEANQTSYSVNVRRGFVLTLVFPSLNSIGGIMTAVLAYSGGLSAAQGAVTAGAWYLFLLSLNRFLFPIMNLSSFWAQIQNGLSAAERAFALIDAKPVVIQSDSIQIGRLHGQVEFDQVSFRYKDSESLLEDFNLVIPAGETIALVGHTGAGKTSIARLVERFYEYQSGKILIDGKDIRTFDLHEYRRLLGIVSQVPFLFSGTVMENIRYARQDALKNEIIEMAAQIGDGEWIETLPAGLDTEVGERGALLSMGQRQLISLMRVLVQRPAIFILDEATASIDPFTEWQIQQALDLILKKSTSILIAHRLSTVKSADRILTMENGNIIEDGDHDSLLAQSGHYANLYNTYFRHQSKEYIENIPSLIQNDRTHPAENTGFNS